MNRSKVEWVLSLALLAALFALWKWNCQKEISHTETTVNRDTVTRDVHITDTLYIVKTRIVKVAEPINGIASFDSIHCVQGICDTVSASYELSTRRFDVAFSFAPRINDTVVSERTITIDSTTIIFQDPRSGFDKFMDGVFIAIPAIVVGSLAGIIISR